MIDINLDDIFKECINFGKKIKNSSLQDCCINILFDYKEKMMNKPATTGSHHYFKGGHLYHTYCVTRNAIKIMEMYDYANVDSDLVIFGALLHDIGKTLNYIDFEDGKSGYRANGSKLLGHSYQGTHIVESYLAKYDLEEEFKNQVLHMIGSHMYSFSDYGTLVKPKMLEVVIIHFADHLDETIESSFEGLNGANKGEEYPVREENGPFYKSLNHDYE